MPSYLSGNKMVKDFTISIALCTYNGEKYIEEQIQSLLNQTHKPDEIIISDDCSKDKTIELVDCLLKYSGINYKIYKQEIGLGVFKNFPFAISQCNCDLVFTCDQDDIWDKTKLEKHLNVFRHNPDVDLVYSNANVVKEDGRTTISLLWPEKVIDDKNKGQASIFSLLYLGRSMAGCCMSFKKSFFMEIKDIPDGIYHDDWIATNAALKNEIIAINEPLISYRQHSNNVVGIKRGGKLSYWKSLLTNVNFYYRSELYLLERHEKMYKGLLIDNITLTTNDDLMGNIDLQIKRTQLHQVPFLKSFLDLTNLLIKGYYSKYNFGFKAYLIDLYRLVFIKLFPRKIKTI